MSTYLERKNQQNQTPAPAVAPPPDLTGATKQIGPPQAPPPAPVTQASTNALVDYFKSGLQDLPYYNTPAFQNLINNISGQSERTLVNQQNASSFQNDIKGYANAFTSQFQSLAGRPPTADEYNTFFEQVVNPAKPWEVRGNVDQNALNLGATNLLGTVFQPTIADAQKQKATQQAAEATAPGSAFDVWQNAYQNSINDTEKALTDYQSRLFEKIRPQLITSLQAQGLLNTGALNDAFAGANADLTNGNLGFIANARQQANQDIANQRYGIMSAPQNAALTTTLNTIPNLTQQGQGALQNIWNNTMQNNAYDLQLRNQQALMDRQNANQPSPLNQYGGLILGGIAGGFGSGLGARMGRAPAPVPVG